MRECTKREPCWLHGALHRRLTLRPSKNIDSGSGSPGDFPISESRTCEQNKCVFFTMQSQKKRPKHYRHLKEANSQPQRRRLPYQARRLAPQALQEREWPAHSPRWRTEQASFVHRAHDIKSREMQQKLLTSSLRQRGTEGRQRRRRRAPWDVPRGHILFIFIS